MNKNNKKSPNLGLATALSHRHPDAEIRRDSSLCDVVDSLSGAWRKTSLHAVARELPRGRIDPVRRSRAWRVGVYSVANERSRSVSRRPPRVSVAPGASGVTSDRQPSDTYRTSMSSTRKWSVASGGMTGGAPRMP